MTSPFGAPLTFSDLDGICFAAERNKLDGYQSRSFHLADLGPWVEMLRLRSKGALDGAPSGLFASTPSTAHMEDALEPSARITGAAPMPHSFVVRPTSPSFQLESLSAFGIAVQKSAGAARMTKAAILRISSPLGEIFDNIHEHSEAYETGMAAFRSLPGSFEFVVADAGVGVLSSLKRSSRFADLADDGQAITRAIQPNVSRFEEPGHGHGFDRLVEGMANLNSELRFRTGDALLQMSSVDGQRLRPILARRPRIEGLIISAKFYS